MPEMNVQINILSKNQFTNLINKENATKKYYQTPAGTLQVSTTNLGVYEAIFIDDDSKTNELLNQNINPDKIVLSGTEFQIKVWQAALQIPKGKTVTYQELANTIGMPKAYRAVANALSKNKIAYFIPCHRIVGKNGKLTGYKWGIEKKAELLKTEKS